ncbi:hypothetical protein EB75_16480 [Mycobacterium sp. ST-F2]|uniref:GtrA family protein n=1 Tax=Mycobacterium sp. ST-F2 TaxID=1490484 RepID=UPI000963103B|nr:GtrA family protein [Mycobacterium sp. ST-F2]OKH85888.1 hypothetical protein EB75_16480 [Mycobacterium sp. ST-F2]
MAEPVEIPAEDRAEKAVEASLGLVTQAWRFVVTGGLSAVVDYSLYVAFMALGVPRDFAKALSFVAGTTTAYLINRRWTFQAPPSKARFAAVILLYAVTFAVQVGINHVCAIQFEGRSWGIPVAFVIAQGTATVINFVVQRTVIFRLK